MELYEVEVLNSYIGKKIRKRRLQMGWSAAVLGEKIGLSQQQISRYECGIQNITTIRLYILADILQCDINYFIEDYLNNNNFSTTI
ncbi:helix-turn-helix transcriptional regulator [Proteus mirabilis]|nr:helix-turn-helix transcriptional regulator [Proteus mirabilis]